jgi:lipoprotein-anchoring transpeptidase ErfK/SrfK
VAIADANRCAGNNDGKLIKISIDQRRLWACDGTKVELSSAVITGLRGHAETETPIGTYHIYAKQTNTTLKGSDSRGAWSDPVYYWMPFLDNQYGTYGFHDATWRKDSAFGNVSPDSQDASHGCIELPLATSKWLYNWAPVGTTVTVEA